MVINQRDVFRVDLGEPVGSERGHRHPDVVIQKNLFSRSRIGTVLVCALTSNLRRAQAPGNVRLEEGEANIPKQGVVNVTQVFSVDKRTLDELIGTLSRERVRQIAEEFAWS